MILHDLLERVRTRRITGPLNSEIKGIAYDSRLVGDSFMFVAVRGFSSDGHTFINEAINNGAAAIVGEDAVDKTVAKEFTARQETAYIEVSDSREALALISAAFYGHPSKRLSLIGITGTNGKTTTSYITKSIIETGGGAAGLIGTICYMTGDKTSAAMNTTPESMDLQRYLSDMVMNKMKYAVLEVSSHALSLKRVEGCSFKVAAFTNFSRDHLDFHGTMDEYLTAKRRIFHYLDAGGSAVVNTDDPVIEPLVRNTDCNVITCGIEKDAMIRAENISEHRAESRGKGQTVPAGLSFTVKTPAGEFAVNSPLIGRFNVYNILMSIGIAYALGISKDVIQEGIHNAGPVEGRFENIDEGQDFLCIVDYAHTDDALRKLIEAARPSTSGKVITVFGCGGDRDRTKRPIMGKVATELSDFVVLTADNPRKEAPEEIVRDIVRGLTRTNYVIQHDRAKAIEEAVAMAGKGDTVLVAGKGHEDYQEIKGSRMHFSDKEVLRKEIKKRLAVSDQL
jgi:UDP-N-acetylmuramoyl-L-alanyl-D-glutamate--2,6-diaminopimelate ligase